MLWRRILMIFLFVHNYWFICMWNDWRDWLLANITNSLICIAHSLTISMYLQVVLVQGHYLSYLPLCSRNEPVFLATCTPIAMPETRECVVQGATNVFTTIHSMDMKTVHVDKKWVYNQFIQLQLLEYVLCSSVLFDAKICSCYSWSVFLNRCALSIATCAKRKACIAQTHAAQNRIGAKLSAYHFFVIVAVHTFRCRLFTRTLQNGCMVSLEFVEF